MAHDVRDTFKYHRKPCPLCDNTIFWDDTQYRCANDDCGIQDAGDDFLDQITSKIPRLRYVDKDGMPTKEDGWCICVFKREDDTLYVMMEDLVILRPHTRLDRKLIAWLPESEFINAFVGDSNG